jgi:hypothetical protein
MAHGFTHSTPQIVGDKTQEMSETSPTKSGSLTLISNLPLELLQLIFGYCTEFEDLPVELYRACPSWIAVTHVCSRWRGAALNNSSLWTSINTKTMRKRWIEAFLERSKASLIDLTIALDTFMSSFSTRHPLDEDEVIALFSAGCTRLRSLHIIGEFSIVYKLLDTLHTATNIRSLSLDTHSMSIPWTSHVLPENLLGGQAPIREARFITDDHIVAPRWLLRGITHFTSNQYIPLRILLDTLHQMPVLHSLMFEGCILNWKGTDSPRDVQIPMQNLMYLTVDVDAKSSVAFALLNQRLALPNGAKKRLRTDMRSSSEDRNTSILEIPPSLRQIIRAANGLQHIQFSSGIEEGSLSFRLWTGDTGYEEAEFSFEFSWEFYWESDRDFRVPIRDMVLLCDLLGVEGVRTLRIPRVSLEWRWFKKLFDLLKKLHALEELELCADAMRELCSALDEGRTRAVLPELRSVRILEAGSTTSDVAERTEELMRVLRGYGDYSLILADSYFIRSGSNLGDPARMTTC